MPGPGADLPAADDINATMRGLSKAPEDTEPAWYGAVPWRPGQVPRVPLPGHGKRTPETVTQHAEAVREKLTEGTADYLATVLGDPVFTAATQGGGRDPSVRQRLWMLSRGPLGVCRLPSLRRCRILAMRPGYLPVRRFSPRV